MTSPRNDNQPGVREHDLRRGGQVAHSEDHSHHAVAVAVTATDGALVLLYLEPDEMLDLCTELLNDVKRLMLTPKEKP